ncbi:hypothetical protein HPB47_024753 [Ixodes persulcatus]|uniref:Uncharacterized protein n=1 Tax=Ixodes persulcatus TaxID=34615 RepID=A0AC60Q3N7_IXOPE|nr:hypothetical protein HPB47_024753 [Ixodes persulcatus]
MDSGAWSSPRFSPIADAAEPQVARCAAVGGGWRAGHGSWGADFISDASPGSPEGFPQGLHPEEKARVVRELTSMSFRFQERREEAQISPGIRLFSES